MKDKAVKGLIPIPANNKKNISIYQLTAKLEIKRETAPSPYVKIKVDFLPLRSEINEKNKIATFEPI